MLMKMALDSRFGEIEFEEDIDDFTCYLLLNVNRATIRIPHGDYSYRVAEVEITDSKLDLCSIEQKLCLQAIEKKHQ